MANKQKAKGTRFENECVSIAEQHGFNSKRAWGSDGRSLGHSSEVDLVINYLLSSETEREMKVQCKVRNKIAILLLSSKIEVKYTRLSDIKICWS